MEELTDILVGLEPRITAYKHRRHDLEKKRRRLDDEIADRAKLAALSSQPFPDEKGIRSFSMADLTESVAPNSARPQQIPRQERAGGEALEDLLIHAI